MAAEFNILSLEIDGVVVEKIRAWDKEGTKQAVKDFKEAYNLTEDDDYSFYLVMQSKMNNHFIPVYKQKNGQKINSH